MESENTSGPLKIPKSVLKRDFCAFYATMRNGTKAAIKAGYSEKTASQKAYELLQEEEVKAYVAYLEKERLAEAEIDAADVILELKKIAFSNIGDYVKFSDSYEEEVENPDFDPDDEEDPDQNPRMIKKYVPGGLQIKDFGKLTADQLAAVSEVSETPGQHGTARKFKLHSKLDALSQIRAMQGLDKPKKSEIEVKNPGALEATRFTLKRRAADPGKEPEA